MFVWPCQLSETLLPSFAPAPRRSSISTWPLSPRLAVTMKAAPTELSCARPLESKYFVVAPVVTWPTASDTEPLLSVRALSTPTLAQASATIISLPMRIGRLRRKGGEGGPRRRRPSRCPARAERVRRCSLAGAYLHRRGRLCPALNGGLLPPSPPRPCR